MDIDVFLKNFSREIGRDGARLDAGTRFKNLPEWTSLNALLVLSMVEEEFGVLLKGEDFRNSETLEDLFGIIVSRKN